MRRLVWIVGVLAGCPSENDLGGIGTDPSVPVEDPDTDTDTMPEADTDTDTDTDTDPDTTPLVCGVPLADAGIDQQTAPLQLVTLSAAGSSDPSWCLPLTYAWRVVSKPAGSSVALLFPWTRDVSPWIDVAGTYDFEVTVTNSGGFSAVDQVEVVAEPSQDFYVQLTWDAACDLDLHVLDGTSTLYDSPYDVCYCNQSGAWGGPGTADDGSLDWDLINGYGPETMTVQSPAPGSYDIKVQYYGQEGDTSCVDGWCPSTVATVRIYDHGTELAAFTQTISEAGQLWNVATVAWPSQTITPVGTVTTTTLSSCF